jgi:cephalosporin hydroxylase
LIPLIFFAGLAILVIVHRHRHQAGWVLKERLTEMFLVGAATFLFGVFLVPLLESDERVAREFHRLYHDEWYETTILQTRWRGVELLKCPLDLWVVQEMIHEIEPDVIVETGTWRGGSAYYFASMFDMFGKGRVLTVDIEKYDVPQHDRISYHIGSSTAPEIIETFKNSINDGEVVMVVLDSNHQTEHVLNELRLYGDMVSVGSYMIVEDMHLGGNPVRVGEGTRLRPSNSS